MPPVIELACSTQVGFENLIVLDDVLTLSECEAVVTRAEATGFGGVASRHQNSTARKCTLNDGGLAAEIFGRIRHALPQHPTATGKAHSDRVA